jgi:hypothetical protein
MPLLRMQAKRILLAKGVEHIDEVRVDTQPEERMKMMADHRATHRTANFHR